MLRIARAAAFSLATSVVTIGLGGVAAGQAAQPGPSASSAQPAKPAPSGVAVLAIGSARDEAFDLARALYASRLRPANLDEVRARVLAGAPPPATASRELRELAEVRAGVTGDNAAGRRLLVGLAQQVGAQALVVVQVERSASPTPPAQDGGSAAADGGVPAELPPATADAGVGGAAGNAAPAPTVIARLFLADTGEFDAARYQPEPGLTGAAAWRSTVASLEAHFPAQTRTVGPSAATTPAPAALQHDREAGKSSPFYASAWFWGALGGAALLGGAFYLASRDTSSDPIHLEMRVPR